MDRGLGLEEDHCLCVDVARFCVLGACHGAVGEIVGSVAPEVGWVAPGSVAEKNGLISTTYRLLR